MFFSIFVRASLCDFLLLFSIFCKVRLNGEHVSLHQRKKMTKDQKEGRGVRTVHVVQTRTLYFYRFCLLLALVQCDYEAINHAKSNLKNN